MNRKESEIEWVDLRGNHDAFNLASPREVLARLESKGSIGPFFVNGSDTNHVFLAVDAAPLVGPSRPWNFFGHLGARFEALRAHGIAGDRAARSLVAFGHYPLCVLSDGETAKLIESLSEWGASMYSPGHLHTLAGFAEELYARHPTGLLEAELGDFKDNRRFRLAALDHGLLSFKDVTLHDWPVVLVTNPKPARLATLADKWWRIRKSTHMRVLVMHPGGCQGCAVTAAVDASSSLSLTRSAAAGSLWTGPWDPSKLGPGLHTLAVTVTGPDGNVLRVDKSEFSVDGTIAPLPSLARWVLLTRIEDGFFLAFWAPHALVLCLMFYGLGKRKLAELADESFAGSSLSSSSSSAVPGSSALSSMAGVLDEQDSRQEEPFGLAVPAVHSLGTRLHSWPIEVLCLLEHRLVLLSLNPLYFQTLVGHSLVSLWGPWLIGELIDGRFGLFFSRGILFPSSGWVTLGDTLYFASLRATFFTFPMFVFVLLSQTDRRHNFAHPRCTHWSFQHSLLLKVLAAAALASQAMTALSIRVWYGWMAFLLCPNVTWTVPLFIYLLFIREKGQGKAAKD